MEGAASYIKGEERIGVYRHDRDNQTSKGVEYQSCPMY